MRTKTSILTAALIAAGAATSMAQSNVYSLNIVGYVNIPVVGGNSYLLCNPFDDGAGNNINSIFSSLNANAFAFDGSTLFLFDPVNGYIPDGYNASTPTTGSWSPGTSVLTPGKGFWFIPDSSGTGTVTFVGSVTLASTNTIGGGEVTLIGSPYPASTNLAALGMNWLSQTNFGFAGGAQDGDSIFRWNPTTQDFSTPPGGNFGFNAVSGWTGGANDGNGPVLNVAEGFFYLNANSDDAWIQNFTVN